MEVMISTGIKYLLTDHIKYTAFTKSKQPINAFNFDTIHRWIDFN